MRQGKTGQARNTRRKGGAMSRREEMLLALAAGLALGRTVPPEFSVPVSLAIMSWLLAGWIVRRAATGRAQ